MADEAPKADEGTRRPEPNSDVANSDVDGQEVDGSEEGPNLLALGLGLLVILGLLLGTWFLVNAMRCNPMFSDAGLYHSRSCR